MFDRSAKPQHPVHWIAGQEAAEALCARLSLEPLLGVDVETTLSGRPPRLCTVQLATATDNFIIDALAMEQFWPLAGLMAAEEVTKVIHNARFERMVFAGLGIAIENVFDTLTASRRLRGYKIEGGHNLATVCHRELGITLDKRFQCSDWTHRPLSQGQIDYAALDAEVLLPLHARLSLGKAGR